MTCDTDSREVSKILRAAREGEPVDMNALLVLVYDKLRAIAARRMEVERPGHTLQATALVNEAYLRLVGDKGLDWSSRAHFYAAAAEAMRRILIDHARGKDRVKRGDGIGRVPLDVVDLATRDNPEEILAVEDAVCRIEQPDGRMGVVVKFRFYAGLSERETAQAMGISERTVQREWALARAWLKIRLSEE